MSLVPALAPETRGRGAELQVAIADQPTPAQRTALAHLAVHRAVQRERRAEVCRLAEVAWGDGELLETDGFPQHRPGQALDDAVHAGRLWEEELGAPSPGALAWRTTAALAQAALGRADAARGLAEEALVLAREIEVRRAIIRAMTVLGLVIGGEDGIEVLAEAVSLGANAPARLVHISALIALGGALRRANQRAAAHDPLKAALALCRGNGATALALEAQTELGVTGPRRRADSLWGPESLTPSERRVAELAVEGLTTREMAESLFITPKTVEFHLRHIYQKLGVNSRDKLSGALGIDR